MMNNLFKIFIFILFCSCSFSNANSYRRKINISAVDLFDKTMEVVNRDFYDQTFKGLPWKQLVGDARARIVNSSLDDVKNEINKLLSLLKTSHTSFYDKNDQEYWALQNIFTHQIDTFKINQIGAWFALKGQNWEIQNIFEGSVAHKSGLKVGDIIVGVNIADELIPFEPISSLNHKGYIPLEVKRDNQALLKKISVVEESYQSSMLRAVKKSKKLIKYKNKKIAYIHLWTGTHKKFKSELESMIESHVNSSDGFILDLRDGFGGMWIDYIEKFMNINEDGKPIRQVYSRPLVVLINGGTRSGKEYTAKYLKDNNRATIIGNKSAGAVVPGRLYNIVDGQYALYLAVAPPGDDGLEGNGLRPDIEVSSKVSPDWKEDLQIRAALDFLTESSGND